MLLTLNIPYKDFIVKLQLASEAVDSIVLKYDCYPKEDLLVSLEEYSYTLMHFQFRERMEGLRVLCTDFYIRTDKYCALRPYFSYAQEDI
jgi:hypothetical protein